MYSSVMSSKNVSAAKVSSILEDGKIPLFLFYSFISVDHLQRLALPLFQPTSNFTHHLELFDACGYTPTIDHPAVQSWLTSLGPSSSTLNSEVDAMNTTARCILTCADSPSSSGRESPYPSNRVFDMTAFSETLVQIHKTSLVGEDTC